MGNETQAVRLRQHRFIKDRGSPACDADVHAAYGRAQLVLGVLAAQRVPVYRADVLQRSHGVGVKKGPEYRMLRQVLF